MNRAAARAHIWSHWRDLGLQAWLSMADHRMRALLSILGIGIGIAAVVLIGVVSEGGKQQVFSELESFGLRTAWLFRDQQSSDPNRVQREGSGIDNHDLQAIRQSNCCPGLRHISPWVFLRDASPAVRANGRYVKAKLEGIDQLHLQINNDRLVLGRDFSVQDIDGGRPYAIIGSKIRERLFPNGHDPLGAELRVGDLRLTIIGVLKPKDRSFLDSIGSGEGDANERVLIPYRRMQTMQGDDWITVLEFEIAPGFDQQAVEPLKALLRQRHRNAFDYRSDSMESHVKSAQSILSGVSTMGMVAAAVSLVVAGLGILNIMSTSVLERTREIGLRKAVGGSSRDILLQFMFEACLISLAGGLLGLLLGSVSSVLIVALTGFPLKPSVPLIVMALLTALAVGILAGLYPAHRAARLRPVEALRYE
ncbi:MAG: ABC transporter permease [Lautropia sp.]|nr:ABC transporter permease [Lautropia sp.]